MAYERIVTRQMTLQKFGHCVHEKRQWRVNMRITSSFLHAPPRLPLLGSRWVSWYPQVVRMAAAVTEHWGLVGDVHCELTAEVCCVVSVTTNQSNRITKNSTCHLKTTKRLLVLTLTNEINPYSVATRQTWSCGQWHYRLTLKPSLNQLEYRRSTVKGLYNIRKVRGCRYECRVAVQHSNNHSSTK